MTKVDCTVAKVDAASKLLGLERFRGGQLSGSMNSSTTIVAGSATAQSGHTGLPWVIGQRRRAKTFSAPLVGHPHDFADAERPRRRRHEEMLGHKSLANEIIT